MEKEEAKGAVVIEEEGGERTATAAPEAAKPSRELEDDDARNPAAAEEGDALATTAVNALDANLEAIPSSVHRATDERFVRVCLDDVCCPRINKEKKERSTLSTDPVSTLAHGPLPAIPLSTLGDAV